jgi:hypothetical protein
VNPVSQTATRPREAATEPRIDFLELLRLLREGDAAHDASQALSAVVEAVKATGKPGHLTLKVKIAPTVKGNAEKVEVKDDIDVTLPKPEHDGSLFYTLEDGQLTRHSTKQRRGRAAVADADQVPEAER